MSRSSLVKIPQCFDITSPKLTHTWREPANELVERCTHTKTGRPPHGSSHCKQLSEKSQYTGHCRKQAASLLPALPNSSVAATAQWQSSTHSSQCMHTMCHSFEMWCAHYPSHLKHFPRANPCNRRLPAPGWLMVFCSADLSASILTLLEQSCSCSMDEGSHRMWLISLLMSWTNGPVWFGHFLSVHSCSQLLTYHAWKKACMVIYLILVSGEFPIGCCKYLMCALLC